ncbi:glutathione S-transferase [Aureimonas sp. Leaf454]|uniref:glutathione S-transferase family protein n=1 Tax=Aureimonas sp. Leaf454 TaxID=1736381 RepID=UPI0006FF27BB|nr:glutathione S-transferase [Aureimonas sp. Leaf454]KQT52694.1 glutathione S-transferase [Aureimonas sp. Leaf454]
MITIHHLNNSRSQRVLWLLEELEVPYEVKRYERLASMQAPPALKAVHPLGKSPILTEGELTLAETGAIVTYILETHGAGRLVPERGTTAYWDYQHFLHYAEGSAMPPLVMKLIFSRLPTEAPFFAKPILKGTVQAVNQRLLDPQISGHLDHWERALGRSGWFAGEHFSAADIMMSFPVEAAASRVRFGQRANLPAFLARIHARPAYKAALERGGPYAYA